MATDYELEDWYGLRDPNDGATDWHRILEYNIKESDEGLIKRGTLADRPTSANADRLYLATDVGVLYRDTGNGWVVTGGTDMDGTDLTDDQGSTVIWDASANHVPASSVQTLSLGSDTDTDLAGSNLSDGTTTIYDATNGWVPEAVLENNGVTVAGNTVTLGGSTAVSGKDLSDSGNIAYLNEAETVTGGWTFDATVKLGATGSTNEGGQMDLLGAGTNEALSVDNYSGKFRVFTGNTGDATLEYEPDTSTLSLGGTAVAMTSRFPLPNSDLTNSSVTIAGNSVSLGGSVNPTLDDFAQAAGAVDLGKNYLTMVGPGGSTFYLGGANTPDATEASGVHLETGTNPTSGDPLFVVESSGGSERLRVEHSGALRTSNNEIYASGNKVWHQGNDGEGSGLNADQWEGYDLQKNGTDGTGVINFKT